ncbi:MAG: hypothetical protein RJA76_1060 [Bacteroidota bacterium]|jgi:hypothetical protein
MKKNTLILLFTLFVIACSSDVEIPFNKGNRNEIVTGTGISSTPSSANLNFSIIDNGGASISETGIMYSYSSNLVNPEMIPLSNKYPGNYSIGLQDLLPNRTYFWRPYAKTNLGFNYGRTSSFTTSALNTTYTNGMVAYYPFNGDYLDYGPYGNHLSLYGSNSYGPGKFGGIKSAASLVPNAGFYKIASSNFPTGSMSVMFWFKANTAVSTLASVGSGANGSANSSATIRLLSPTRIGVYHWNADYFLDFPWYNFTDGSWYFMACVYDSITKKFTMYIGKKSTTANSLSGYSTGNYTLNNQLNWSIKNISVGCLIDVRNNNPSEFFNGQIDDFRLFNRAITSDDVNYFINQ